MKPIQYQYSNQLPLDENSLIGCADHLLRNQCTSITRSLSFEWPKTTETLHHYIDTYKLINITTDTVLYPPPSTIQQHIV